MRGFDHFVTVPETTAEIGSLIHVRKQCVGQRLDTGILEHVGCGSNSVQVVEESGGDSLQGGAAIEKVGDGAAGSGVGLAEHQAHILKGRVVEEHLGQGLGLGASGEDIGLYGLQGLALGEDLVEGGHIHERLQNAGGNGLETGIIENPRGGSYFGESAEYGARDALQGRAALKEAGDVGNGGTIGKSIGIHRFKGGAAIEHLGDVGYFRTAGQQVGGNAFEGGAVLEEAGKGRYLGEAFEHAGRQGLQGSASFEHGGKGSNVYKVLEEAGGNAFQGRAAFKHRAETGHGRESVKQTCRNFLEGSAAFEDHVQAAALVVCLGGECRQGAGFGEEVGRDGFQKGAAVEAGHEGLYLGEALEQVLRDGFDVSLAECAGEVGILVVLAKEVFGNFFDSGMVEGHAEGLHLGLVIKETGGDFLQVCAVGEHGIAVGNLRIVVEDTSRDLFQKSLGEHLGNVIQFGVLGEDVLIHVGDTGSTKGIAHAVELRAVVEKVGRDFRDISAGVEHIVYPQQFLGIFEEAFRNGLKTGLGEHFTHVLHLGESTAVVRGNGCKALAVLEGAVKFGEAQLAPVVDLLYHVSIVRTIVIAVAQAGHVTPDGYHIAVLVGVGMLRILSDVAQFLHGTVAPVHLDIRSALDRKDGFIVYIAVGVGLDDDGHHEGLDVDTGLGDHNVDGLDILRAVTGGDSHDGFAGFGVSVVLAGEGERSHGITCYGSVFLTLDVKPVRFALYNLIAPVIVGSNLDGSDFARERLHGHHQCAGSGIYLAVLGNGNGFGHFLGALACIQDEGSRTVGDDRVVVGFERDGVAFFPYQQPIDTFGLEVPVVNGALYREGCAGFTHGCKVEIVLAGNDFRRAVSVLGGADGSGEVTGLDGIPGSELPGLRVPLCGEGECTSHLVRSDIGQVVTLRLHFPVGDVGIHIDDNFSAQAFEGEGGILAVRGREERVFRGNAERRSLSGGLFSSGNRVFLDHFLLHAGRSCHKEAYC